MEWSRDFTALVLSFAERFASVDDIPMEDALLHGTPLYPSMKLGTEFQRANPVWQAFLAGWQMAEDRVEWTHKFYLAHARQYPSHPYGCFRYHYDAATRTAGLHFGNLDRSGRGALSRERRPERIRELTALFTDVRRAHPEAEWFAGGSWLYNLPAYRALFPAEYVESMEPGPVNFVYFNVWGQFLDRAWDVRPEPAARFKERLATATDHAGLEASFPLPPLRGRAAIEHFYRHYGIS